MFRSSLFFLLLSIDQFTLAKESSLPSTVCDFENFCLNGGLCVVKEPPVYFHCKCALEYSGFRCQHWTTDKKSAFDATTTTEPPDSSYRQGYRDGFLDGFQDGYNTGYKKGFNDSSALCPSTTIPDSTTTMTATTTVTATPMTNLTTRHSDTTTTTQTTTQSMTCPTVTTCSPCGTTTTHPESSTINPADSDMTPYCNPNMVKGYVVFLVDLACTVINDGNKGKCAGFDPKNEIDQIKSFLLHFGDNMALGYDHTRLGILPYAGTVLQNRLMTPDADALKIFDSKTPYTDYVQKELQKLATTDNTHSIYTALEFIVNAVKTGELSHKSVVILVSSGIDITGTSPTKAAEVLKHLGVTIGAISPSKINAVETRLLELVSQPLYFYEAGSYEKLPTKESYEVVYLATCTQEGPTTGTMTSKSTVTTQKNTLTTKNYTLTTPRPKTPPADLIFLLETSELVGSDYMIMAQQTVIRLANRFSIGPDEVRVALVHFSSPDERSAVVTKLEDTTDFSHFHDQVANLNFSAIVGISDLSLGLKLVTDSVISTSGIPQNPKFVILLARGSYDQSNTCCPEPLPEAARLNKLATILAMEIPVQGDRDMLANIADSSTVFGLNDDWTVYNAIVFHLNSHSTTPTTTPFVSTVTYPQATVAPSCEQLDILFIVDVSQSIGPANFGKIKELMISVLDQFSVGTEAAQFGAVLFAQKAYLSFYLNTLENKDSLRTAIKAGLQWLDGVTNIASSFDAAEQIFITDNGDRPTVPNVVLLLTDGHTTPGFNDPVPAAAKFRTKSNAKIIAVAIENSNRTVLSEITGTDHNVVIAYDWYHLASVFSEVISIMCEPPTTAQTTTTVVTTTTVGPSTTIGPYTTTGSSTMGPSTTTESSTMGPSTTTGSSTIEPSTTTGSSTMGPSTTTGSSTIGPSTTTGSSTMGPSTTTGSSTIGPSTTTGSSTMGPSTTTGSSTMGPSTTTGSSTMGPSTTAGSSTMGPSTTTGSSTMGASTTTISGSSTSEITTSDLSTTPTITSTQLSTTERITTTEKPCGPFDVVVLMDVSATVTTQGFQTVIYFMKKYFGHFQVGQGDDQVRVGFVTVASSPNASAPLSRFHSNQEFNDYLNSLSFTGSSTGLDLSDALGYEGASAKSGYFGSASDRPDVPNYVVIFASRFPESMFASKLASSILKSRHAAKVITMTGMQVPGSFMKGISSGNSYQFQFSSYNNQTADVLTYNVRQIMCM